MNAERQLILADPFGGGEFQQCNVQDPYIWRESLELVQILQTVSC